MTKDEAYRRLSEIDKYYPPSGFKNFFHFSISEHLDTISKEGLIIWENPKIKIMNFQFINPFKKGYYRPATIVEKRKIKLNKV